MDWKDHLKAMEQMRDSTRPSYCKAPSSPSRSRSPAYATGGHVSPSYSRGEERAVPQTRRREMQQLAAQGRGGDTELAEIGSRTARMLDELIHGGRRRRNPRTGLLEYVRPKSKLKMEPAAAKRKITTPKAPQLKNEYSLDTKSKKIKKMPKTTTDTSNTTSFTPSIDIPHPGTQKNKQTCSVRTAKSFSNFYNGFPATLQPKDGNESEDILNYVRKAKKDEYNTLDARNRKKPKFKFPVKEIIKNQGVSITDLAPHLGFNMKHEGDNPTPQQIKESVSTGNPSALILKPNGMNGYHVVGNIGHEKVGKQDFLHINDSLNPSPYPQTERVPFTANQPINLKSGQYNIHSLWSTSQKQ